MGWFGKFWEIRGGFGRFGKVLEGFGVVFEGFGRFGRVQVRGGSEKSVWPVSRAYLQQVCQDGEGERGGEEGEKFWNGLGMVLIGFLGF